MGIQPVFSIWWVIAVGALSCFVVVSLLQQRAASTEHNIGLRESGDTLADAAPVRTALRLVQLQEFPFAPDQASRVKPMGVDALGIQDVRVYESATDVALSAMPAAVQMHLKSAYDAGNVFGPMLPRLLTGGSLRAGERIFFALVIRGESPELLAYS